jgi:crotonobetainyl-CoA:carnitine CoA-transferase CaiB-like acyl-CoA transferase
MVRDVSEAAGFEHLASRGLRLPINVPGLPQNEDVDIVNTGFLMSEDGPHVDEPPPRLDEHRAEILDWLTQKAKTRQGMR